jgi:hypothetical protein
LNEESRVMSTKITVNGQTYSSADEMPPDVRAKYDRAMAAMADRDNNGIPDVLEHPAQPGQTNVGVVRTNTRIVVNGKEYKSLEEVPLALRSLIGNALHERAGIAGAPDARKSSTGMLTQGAVSGMWSITLGGILLGFILGVAAAVVAWKIAH